MLVKLINSPDLILSDVSRGALRNPGAPAGYDTGPLALMRLISCISPSPHLPLTRSLRRPFSETETPFQELHLSSACWVKKGTETLTSPPSHLAHHKQMIHTEAGGFIIPAQGREFC